MCQRSVAALPTGYRPGTRSPAADRVTCRVCSARVTLARFFVLAVGAVAAAVAAVLVLSMADSRQVIVKASDEVRHAAADKVAAEVSSHLAAADEVISDVEVELRAGLAAPTDGDAMTRLFVAELLRHRELAELAFTWAPEVGREQIDLWNPATPNAPLDIRRITLEGTTWVGDIGAFDGEALHWQRGPAVPQRDPAQHPTYTTPAARVNRNKTLISDLSFAQADQMLPPEQRRRVVTAQRAILDRDGHVLGVVRAAVQSSYVDEVTRLRVETRDPHDPDRIFLCDRLGRLLTPLSPHDHTATLDDAGRPSPDGDVRVVPAQLPPAIAAALRLPALRTLDRDGRLATRVTAGGEGFLVTFAALPPTIARGWVVGIVVPESYYLSDLVARRRRLAIASAIVLALVVLSAAIALRAMRRAFGRVVAESERMSRFDFAPHPSEREPFRDVAATLDNLEHAKTALRAMGKYVPVTLVRQLYAENVDPAPGAQPRDLSIMFTDIEGFTSITEALEPDRLAVGLGRYLECMTQAVHAHDGTVDKFIGDAVMALWNAPGACTEHPLRACRAVLTCVRATDALYASRAWGGLPAWRTRFGLHRAEVMVGHFGAPDRLSYTALGDGVNLAARLEGLNKQYGTFILASDAIRAAAGDELVFRRIDRVAVKGKREATLVWELVGERGELDDEQLARLAAYEHALAAYFARAFDDALADLAPLVADDPPSRVLAERCRRMRETPPPGDWDGVFVADEK